MKRIDNIFYIGFPVKKYYHRGREGGANGTLDGSAKGKSAFRFFSNFSIELESILLLLYVSGGVCMVYCDDSSRTDT